MREILTPLLLLACPIGMGVMMWFMMRGARRKPPEPEAMSMAELRAEHARLGGEMDRAAAREEVSR